MTPNEQRLFNHFGRMPTQEEAQAFIQSEMAPTLKTIHDTSHNDWKRAAGVAASVLPMLSGGMGGGATNPSSSVPPIPGAGGGFSIPNIVGGIGRVASGIESQRGENRLDQGAANNNYDTNRLNYAEHNLKAPGQRAHNSVQGDILAGVQPVTVNGPITGTHGHIPQISGGLSPALLSENSRNLGKDMSRQALMDQMQGPMNPTAQPQAGAVDTALSGASYAGLAAETLGAFRKPKPTQIPEIPTPWSVDRLNSLRSF